MSASRSTFARELDKVPVSRTGPECGVKVVLDKLDKASRRDVEAAIAARDTYTAPQILKALQAMGHKVGEWQLGKHRRQGCGCFR